MGDHSTWYQYLFFNAYNNLEGWASHYLTREWRLAVGFTDTHFTLVHVLISATVATLLTLGALRYRSRLNAMRQEGPIPDPGFGVRNVFELIIEATLSLAEGVMGREKAEKFLPFVGALVFFILFNNLIGLVPGFLPATDTIKTNAALALMVFLYTHYLGFKEHGLKYIKQFLGPVWWLAPLMFLIELISHAVRPISLTLRLMGNMIGDHKVLATFIGLLPILVPLPFYVLGILVCIVQTVVFSLLTMVYFDLALQEEH